LVAEVAEVVEIFYGKFSATRKITKWLQKDC